jgi:hypothetical protein
VNLKYAFQSEKKLYMILDYLNGGYVLSLFSSSSSSSLLSVCLSRYRCVFLCGSTNLCFRVASLTSALSLSLDLSLLTSLDLS